MDKAYLEIDFHLINGRMVRFAEEDAKIAQEILNAVKPASYFSDEQMLVSDCDSLTGINLSSISWVDIRTGETPGWAFPLHIRKAEVMDETEFRAALEKEAPVSATLIESGNTGLPMDMFMEMTMACGSVFHFRLHTQTLLRMEKLRIPKIISELSTFHGLRKEGGGVLLNMQNCLMWTSHPGPREVPEMALKARLCLD